MCIHMGVVCMHVCKLYLGGAGGLELKHTIQDP